jgi:AcrR family transcriptional regulator
MSKSDAKRAEMVDRLADHVLAHGLIAASLRPLAAALGTSDRMLLYYFRDKSELIALTLDRVAARFAVRLSELAGDRPRTARALEADLAAIAVRPDAQPYLRIWLEIAALAGPGDPFYREVGARIGQGFVDWTAARLALRNPARRRAAATRLVLTVEGLVLLGSVGMADLALAALGAAPMAGGGAGGLVKAAAATNLLAETDARPAGPARRKRRTS